MLKWLRGLLKRGSPRSDHFELAVRGAFAYLVRDYGFRELPARAVAYASWVEYEKPGVKVTVYRESGSGVHVTLLAAAAIEPGLRREFGLHELEQEMEKAGLYKRQPTVFTTLEEGIEHAAAVLATIGEDVLNGDFALLLERQRRHLEAVRRNRRR